jgi:hypothetical protein
MALRTRVQITGMSGGPALSTMYWLGETQGDAEAAIAAVAAGWSALEANLANDIAWSTEPDVDTIDAQGVLTGSFQVAVESGAGTSVNDPLAWATQGLLRWGTGVIRNGREVRGRTYLPGFTEADNVNGAPAPSAITVMQAAVAGFLPATGAVMVIWARPSPDLTTGQFAPVQGGSPWNRWAVLRSRRD